MKRDRSVSQIITVFVFMISGLIFYNPALDGKSVLASLVIYLIIGILLPIILFSVFEKAYAKKNAVTIKPPARAFFALMGILLLIICSGVYVSDCIKLISSLSEGYQSPVFAIFCMLLSVFLCTYAANGKYETLSRICCLIFIPLIVIAVSSVFSLFSEKASIHFAFGGKFALSDIGFAIVGGIYLFFDLIIFYFLFYKNEAMTEQNKRKKVLIYGSCFALLFIILETVKYLLLFGEKDLNQIQNVEMTAFSMISYVRLNEIYSCAVAVAFTMKVSFYLTAAYELSDQPARSAKASKVVKYTSSVLVFCLALSLYFRNDSGRQTQGFIFIIPVILLLVSGIAIGMVYSLAGEKKTIRPK